MLVPVMKKLMQQHLKLAGRLKPRIYLNLSWL
jgi:hypothetical protein